MSSDSSSLQDSSSPGQELDMDEVLKFLEEEIQSFEKLFDELNGQPQPKRKKTRTS